MKEYRRYKVSIVLLILFIFYVGVIAFSIETFGLTSSTAIRISTNGQNFIKEHEGFHDTAYDDGFGNWTIGWGHTSGVTEGMTVTKEQAQSLFEQDLIKKEKIVNDYEKQEGIVFTQQQYDALVSLVFNLSTNPLGEDDYRLTKAIKKYQSGSSVNIPAEKVWECFATWHHANHVDVKGLFYRRLNEARIFIYGEYIRKQDWEIPSWLVNGKEGPDVPDGWVPEEYSSLEGVTIKSWSSEKNDDHTCNITIKWNAVSGASSYNVYRRIKGGEYGDPIATKISASSTSYKDPAKLPAGNVYYYRVFAVDKNGNTSPKMDGLPVYTSPVVTSVKATGTTTVELKWDTKDDVTYRISRRKDTDAADSYTTIKENYTTGSFKDTGLDAGTKYWYRIHAYNDKGCSNCYASYSVTTKKQYTVTYNANGGSGAPAAQIKVEGTALTLATAKPTRTGYTFKGWATSATATTAQYQPGASYSADSAVTLYAVWNKDVVEPTGVSLNLTTLNRVVGETYTFTATVTPSNATNKNVTWTSSDASVVTVDSSGKIEALKIGTSTITATTADGGRKATCVVTVKAADTLTFSSTQTIANGIYRIRRPGTTYVLTVQGASNDSGANICIMQESENDYYQQFRFEYVSDGYYKVTNVGSGMCLDDYGRGTKPGTNIQQWTPNGGPAQLWQPVEKENYYYLTPQCAPNLVADIEYGVNSDGTNVSLWIPKGGGNQLFELVPVCVITGITVSPAKMTVVIDETEPVTATITPSSAKDKTVIWTSSNPEVATVNGSGRVTGVNAGTTVITATTVDGGYTASCTVTVEDQPNLVLSTQPTVEEGTYWIKMSRALPVLTTENNNSTALGSGIQIWEKDRENLFQQFEVTYVGEGYYNIWNVGSGLAMEVEGSSTAAGAKIVQNAVDTGKASQQWQIVPSPAGDGYYYLLPRSSTDLSAVVHMGYTANGTNLLLWNPKAYSHYKFDLVPVKMEMDEPDFILPGNLTKIEEEAFAGLPMTVVKCPETLTEIESRAFADCGNLKEIYIPESTTIIAEDAFDGCEKLTIWGISGSEAERYAQDRGYIFESVK